MAVQRFRERAGMQWPLMRTTVSDPNGKPAPPMTQAAVPGLPAMLVRIPRTHQILDVGTLGPVTLLSAPAGWGKTVALSSWLTSGDVARPAAWLTLECDDDGARFWSRLGAALADMALPDNQIRPPPPTDGPDALADWLRATGPLRLVLDDFNVISDPSVLGGIDRLVRHSAGQLRLVIATRTDPDLPLHRWRLSGDLTELRTEELSFTLEETAQLLARHEVELLPTEVNALHTRTEGWPGGIQLAALAMRGRADAAQVAANFSGEDETVSQYLQAEVLANLPPEDQDLLLCASVADSVCGDLANALTERRDGEQRLADLRHANAFLVPIESRPAWYRFHHLFGDMLRARLRRSLERCRLLHQRAAAWYTGHDLPIAALRHALATEDQHLASTLLRENWPRLALCGLHERGSPVPSSPWTGAAAPETIGQTLACAAERLEAKDVRSADRLLKIASCRQYLRDEDPQPRAELVTAGLRVARARLGDDRAAVVSAAGELLDLLEHSDPGSDDADVQFDTARTIAMTALGTAQLGLGDLQSAGETLAEGAAGGVAGVRCAAVVCTGGLAVVQAVLGDLRQADQLARAALAMGPCPGQSPCLHCEPAYLALAIVHHEWNRSAGASRFLELADRSRELCGDKTLAAWSVLLRAWLLLAAGDLGGAHAILLDGRGMGVATSSPHMQRWFAAAEADVRTACGEQHTVPGTLTPLIEDVQATSAPVALALAHAYLRDGDVHAAARALPQWSDESKADPFLALRLDAGLVEAVTASRMGDARRAATALERVLQLAEPGGFRRVFVSGGPPVRQLLAEQLEYGTAYWSLVRDLVEAPPAALGGPVRANGPAEPLTERELTVLRYQQSILSNEEIASKLFVSVNTVKTHVRNIYRKLNVARRRDAVRRARELHLL